VTSELAHLLIQYAIGNVQTQRYPVVYRAGTDAYESFYEDIVRFFRVGLPYFQKWAHVPSDYEQVYQQALVEMRQPDFEAAQSLVTAWGVKQ